jgi:cellulose synthase/poly-beta-1,6-N-acetylglucosamine synthase-like glycosyltransferase
MPDLPGGADEPHTTARVLIVIPTLGDRVALLEQTLESVTGQRVDGERAADVVLVTPRAAHAARELAERFGASVVDDPGGLSAAINSGLDAAEPQHLYGNWIGDDDLLAPDSLATTVAALDADPGAVAAFGYCDYVDADGRRLVSSRAGRLAPWLMTWGPDLVPQPGSLFRLDAVRAVGGIDPTLSYAMDLDLLLRLRRRGRLVNTRRTLASFRWHATSTTVANRRPSLEEAEMVKRRYLSAGAGRISPLWEQPVRLATGLAARFVSSLAAR